MSDALVKVDALAGLAREFAKSALMPMALRKRPEDILVTLQTGAELGLQPMQSIRGIHVINGKASLSADLMAALCKRSNVCEYLVLVESSAQKATYKAKRAGDPEATTLSFTIEEAKAAGLTSNPTYQKYPAAMLRARALAAICRAVFPDLCLGLYDSDTGEISQDERDVTPVTEQRAHVESVAAAVRASVAENTVDGEIVPEPTSAPTSAVDAVLMAINGATSHAELTAVLPAIAKLTAEEKTRVRPMFVDKKAKLS